MELKPDALIEKIRNIETEIQIIKEEIQAIKDRNRRVEADKAWEVSAFRLFAVAFATYMAAAGIFYCIGVRNFLLNALIPATAYIVSTQSLPVLKRRWIKKKMEKTCKTSGAEGGTCPSVRRPSID